MFMEQKRSNRALRWIALLSVVINIAFNYFYPYLPLGISRMNEISDKYESRFSPAGYAFSIWGVIYLSFIIYAIAQLLPAHRNDKVYDRIAPFFALVNILAAVWVYVFGSDMIGASVVIIAAMVLVGSFAFGLAKDEYLHHNGSFWLTVPFSLFQGWITVAAIADLSVFLISRGWEGNIFGATTWVPLMLAAAFLMAVVVSIAFRDFIYPLVVAWATIAIWAANRSYEDAVGKIALGCGVVLLLWSIGCAVWQFRLQRGTGHRHIEA